MLIQWLRGEMLRPYYSDDPGGGGGAAQSDTTTTTTTTDSKTEPDDDFDRERAMATIQKLRGFEKEAKAKLKRLEELEAAETARSQADLSAADKLQKELDALKQQHMAAAAQLRRAQLKDAAHEAAQKAGLAFAPGALQDAVALGAFDDLEVADDGDVAGIGEAVKRLQKQRPYLFAAAVAAPNTNGGARSNASGALITDEERQRAQDRYRRTF